MKVRTTNFKFLCLGLLLSTTLLFVLAFRADPEFLKTVVNKLRAFTENHPQEKLYIHLDKPFYVAGDSIWFKAYLVEASLHTLDSQSNALYVELLNSKNEMVQRKMLFINGVSFGDFALPDTLTQGKYLIRGYTNYMRNTGEDFFFKKEVSILNPTRTNAKLQPEMMNPDSTDLQFFPEGGELVACGKFSRIAFRAVGQDGKSIQVEGEIRDDQQTLITSFKAEHEGMGLAWLNPEAGKSYHARITKPFPVNTIFQLPSVKENGYVLQVNQPGKNITIIAFTTASAPVPIGLVIQSRGKVYHVQEGVIKEDGFFTTLPADKLPEGINQITLFDTAGRPVAERLIYVHHGESLSLKLEVDSSIHKKRGRVTVYADVAYANGSPAYGNFSITVYDDDLLPNPVQYPLTITSYLSLVSDLKGNISNPGYYFKDSNPETQKHLDLLMLTHGWRRFAWIDVLEGISRAPQYNFEKGVPLSGRVMRVMGKKPLAGSTVKIMTMDGHVVVTKPDSTGRFSADRLFFYDSMSLVIQVENEKRKKQPNTFLLDPILPAAAADYSMPSFIPFTAPEYVKQQAEKNKLDKSINAILLQEFKVTAKKPDPELESKMIGPVATAFKVGDLGKGYVNILEILQSRVPGVRVDGNPPRMKITMRGNPNILILLDGRETDQAVIETLSPSNIELIEIFQNGFARSAGMPALNFVTRTNINEREPIGITQIRYSGFYHAREFYSPRYDVPQDRHSVDDKRTTLYWEPMVQTDNHGRAAVSFFTADVNSTYRIVMEGITPDGYAGTATQTFRVE